MTEELKLTREYIQIRTVDYFRKADGTRPDLRLVLLGNGRKIIVKDFKKSGWFFKTTLGPIMIAREYDVLERLRDVDGVPRPVQMIDKYAFAMEYVDGVSLDKITDKKYLTAELFDGFKKIVAEMHERNIAHCDLRCNGNYMRRRDGKPYIIDFAAAMIKGKNAMHTWFYNNFEDADTNAVLRLVRKKNPDLLSEEDLKELQRVFPLERAAKAVGNPLKAMFKIFSGGKVKKSKD